MDDINIVYLWSLVSVDIKKKIIKGKLTPLFITA